MAAGRFSFYARKLRGVIGIGLIWIPVWVPRAGLWGSLGSAVFPLLTDRADQIFWTCPFGAIVAVALVAIARQAETSEAKQPMRLREVVLGCALTPVRDALSAGRR